MRRINQKVKNNSFPSAAERAHIGGVNQHPHESAGTKRAKCCAVMRICDRAVTSRCAVRARRPAAGMNDSDIEKVEVNNDARHDANENVGRTVVIKLIQQVGRSV
jgi:hypothetical protein